jgi:hypothetical protein
VTLATLLGLSMSTPGDGTVTYPTITGNYFTPTPFTTQHDDGEGLFLNGSSTDLLPAGSENEQSNAGPEAFTIPVGSGTFLLAYTEDNGAPAILENNVPAMVAAPEPTTLTLLGSGLFSLAMMRRRKLSRAAARLA